jgi:DNA anti-recombination protein RmuC
MVIDSKVSLVRMGSWVNEEDEALQNQPSESTRDGIAQTRRSDLSGQNLRT